MIPEMIEQQQELQAKRLLEQEQLARLEGELHTVDAELESLSAQREQYELVDNICSSLNRLDEMGAAGLFWGEKLDASDWQARLTEIGEQSAVFCATIDEIESRRTATRKRILEQEDLLEIIDYQLLELLEEEEQRQLEWLVEREEQPTVFRRMIMPWTRGFEEDRRFQRTLASSVIASLLLAILLSLVDLPIPDRDELMAVPDRVAKVIDIPPPPPVQQAMEPEPEEVPEPDEPLVVEDLPDEATEEIVNPVEVAQEKPPAPEVRSKGILAFRESFSDRAKNAPSARLGAEARIGNSGEAAVGRSSRAMVTTNAPGSSGGINLASISRDVGGGAGGGQLGNVQVSQVASSIGGNGSGDRPRSGGPAAGRTDEEIQIVFDRYKAALYRLYNKELRRDPTLRGELVLKLTIEPNGSVSMCALHSTDIKAPSLADQVVARVKGFDFGAKENISAMTIIYPIDFLPATT